MIPDQAAAWHESGHCLAALRRGWALRSVRLSPGAPGVAGSCEVAEWLDHVADDPVFAIVYMMAGAAAVRRAAGRTAYTGDEQDRVQAAAIAELVLQQDAPRAQKTIQACTALADAMMADDRTWREVQVVAGALRRRKCLSGDDVRRLLAEEPR